MQVLPPVMLLRLPDKVIGSETVPELMRLRNPFVKTMVLPLVLPSAYAL